MTEKKIFSLYQVARSVQRTLSDRYQSAFWVKAEMNKLNYYKHSGHCYPELVEKQDGKVIALVNSTLWNTDYLRANKAFLDLLNEPLKDGIKILFLAKITFDPAHGLSLRILEIDPSFTLGDLEREKQETLQKLKLEGVFEQNKRLKFPLLPQRIAIISVETSKGYADFLSVIDQNQWNYKFFHMLFPSLLQGEKAVDGILSQLELIEKVKHHFDIVAIIRGGGGDVGLSCYNSYKLARVIAEFPLPVVTGIGHATNETVSEMISHLNAITPTKLADYLIQKFHNVAVPLARFEEQLASETRALLNVRQNALQTEVKWFRSATVQMVTHHNNRVKSLSESLYSQSVFRFRNNRLVLNAMADLIRKHSVQQLSNSAVAIANLTTLVSKNSMTMVGQNEMKIANLENIIRIMDPKNVLKRGYSIAMKNGKSVTSADEVQIGDELVIKMYEGEITTTVKNKKDE